MQKIAILKGSYKFIAGTYLITVIGVKVRDLDTVVFKNVYNWRGEYGIPNGENGKDLLQHGIHVAKGAGILKTHIARPGIKLIPAGFGVAAVASSLLSILYTIPRRSD